MPANQLTESSTFTVKESALTNLLVGGFLMILAVLGFFADPHEGFYGMKIYYRSIWIMLVPAIIFLIRGFLHKTIFTIDKNGIYQYGKLVTDWKNFVSANITQKEITGSIKDNFILVIDYYNTEELCYHERTIPLADTQTKSEEEIIAAINFFYDLYKKKTPAGSV
jgi:hypothetical protein